MTDERERRDRWWRTYDASLTGLRSLDTIRTPMPPAHGPPDTVGTSLARAQAQYIKSLAKLDADVAHGELEP